MDTGKTKEVTDAIRKYKRIQKVNSILGCLPSWIEIILIIAIISEILYLLIKYIK